MAVLIICIKATEIFDLARVTWEKFFWVQEDNEKWDYIAIRFLRNWNGSREAGRIDIRVEDPTALQLESVFIFRGFEGALKSSPKVGGASVPLRTPKGVSALSLRVARTDSLSHSTHRAKILAGNYRQLLRLWMPYSVKTARDFASMFHE